MNQVTLEDRASADQLRWQTEICLVIDPDGNELGKFIPKFNPDDWEVVGGMPSDEELSERAKQEGGRTLAEIMADLEKRAQE